MVKMRGDAWQVRDAQRQMLFRGLIRDMWQAAEKYADDDSQMYTDSGSPVYTEDVFLALVAKETLRKLVVTSPDWRDPDDVVDYAWGRFYYQEVRPRIEEFARSDEERDWLLAKFMQKVDPDNQGHERHAAFDEVHELITFR